MGAPITGILSRSLIDAGNDNAVSSNGLQIGVVKKLSRHASTRQRRPLNPQVGANQM
jgi:hypothetical protein